MAEETVRVTLKGTYGYFNARKGVKEKFGPGENIEVPKGLAYSLGLWPPKGVAIVDNQPVHDDLTALGLRAEVLSAVQEAGFTTFASIAAATTDVLTAVKGVGVQTAERIKVVAEAHLAEEQES